MQSAGLQTYMSCALLKQDHLHVSFVLLKHHKQSKTYSWVHIARFIYRVRQLGGAFHTSFLCSWCKKVRHEYSKQLPTHNYAHQNHASPWCYKVSLGNSELYTHTHRVCKVHPATVMKFYIEYQHSIECILFLHREHKNEVDRPLLFVVLYK